jgi:hypothetical protein
MIRTRGRWAIVAVALGTAGVAACLPRVVARAADPALTTRDELVRKWDLNKDGVIDEGELEIARAKMRRERVDLQLGAGLDPLTGRPREASDDQPAQADAPTLPALPEPEPRRKSGQGAALPGTQLPDVRPPIPSSQTQPPAAGPRPAGSPPAASSASDGGSRGGVGTRGDMPRRDAAGRVTFRGLAAGEDRGVVTGGARAGAPARPGYGAAVPKPDLNAGRLPAGLPGRRPVAPASGGLLPNLRSTRPTLPPPPPVTPSRRTIDDFDVY